MAELFARRENSKRALELIERAMQRRGREARLFEAKARYLRSLGRADEARGVVAEAIEAVRRACQSDQNLMDPIIHAVKVDVTLGEICDVFRDEFGVYRDPAFV